MRTQNVSEQNQKHFLCPGHKICVSNKCCARGQTGKHLCRQQCVRNSVSSFARTFKVPNKQTTTATATSTMAVYACVIILCLFLCYSSQTTMQKGHILHIRENVTYYGQFLEFHSRILSCLTYSVWNISGSNRQLKLNESKFLQGSQVEHKVFSEMLLLLLLLLNKLPFTVWVATLSLLPQTC